MWLEIEGNSYTFSSWPILVKLGIGPLSLLFESILSFPQKMLQVTQHRGYPNKVKCYNWTTYKTWRLVRLLRAGTGPVKPLPFRRLYSESTTKSSA